MKLQRRLSPLIAALALLAVACAPQPTREEGAQRPAQINVELCKAYINEEDYELAKAKCEKALAQEPDYAPAHGAVAELYKRLGEYDKADRHFERAIRLDPDDSRTRNNYGVFLCIRERLGEAEEQFLKAVRNPLYETPHHAYTNAGVCALRAGDMTKAEKYFRAALRSDPRLPLALFQMALVSYEQEDYFQARAYVQRYMAAGRQTAASLWLGIRVERKLGDKDAASSYALKLKSNFPDSEETRLLQQLERDERQAGN
ncbi:MAG: type IV pilus biogenesis/stability protein PilW [Gammaproteobacteria bacterium]|nr:type IV pilus biogenesis/stability protein PilW [Gammaproteobacteria bacterium]NIR97906.1 type IV pilus biogenesis/stability protein PilW [Gammaproteobacteria bacterium]NIT63611.1 type IV pilus biogenesis/stability protein PilW [Gammaproteobacteria bacterium]NIV20547.1 type IV pilus biogenesis/stability protein PilW [Gammaproteobacteria bacterium]NIX11141.1 type IV pilus biogenesis/stability protein PilW [Gammaproteobacteria bacterium]